MPVNARALWLVFILLAAIGGAILIGQGTADATAPGLWSQLIIDIQTVQRDLHRELAAAMRKVHADGPIAAGALMVASFLYGVFHAAGPGHGKVVVSTYLFTHESAVRRGIALSFFAAICQGLTAILLVEATLGVLGFTFRQTQGATTQLESASYAMIALVGAILAGSRIRRLATRPRDTSHDAEPSGEHSSHCGHTHGPTHRDLEKPLSWHGFMGIAGSIGIRPCTGAILVLLVANSFDLRWAGIAAVVAMSVGTAITVSFLAILSVYARSGMLRLMQYQPNNRLPVGTILDGLAICGGLLILVAGMLLLQASVAAPVHPLR